MPRRRRSRKFSRDPIEVEIESLSHEGRGITRINGKTVFVFGALVGETVIIEIVKSSRKFDEAKVLEVIKPSPDRIEPRCAAYQQCGGCSLQHIDNSTQIQLKQQSLLDMLTHAGISWGTLLPPLESQSWGYRGKARLGVKFVEKKGRVLVGFRERNSPYVCDMHRCEVLIPEVGENLDSLSEMIGKLDARALIPQIEVAADGDQIQLVFRHLKPLSEQDQQRLIEFGRRFNFMIQLQSGGPDTVVDLYPQNQVLQLRPLQDVDLKIEFRATDFVQVNRELNQKMIRQALNLLSLNENDRVLDLFCGLGNFTLPMARLCQQVVGVEGDLAMVERAGQGALRNQLTNTEYHVKDLTQPDATDTWFNARYEKVLLDPPRSGAQEIVQLIDRFNASRIVYVSCQASSLVRDAGIICNRGYKLSHIGVMDMFPQTAHIEAMAIFEA